MQTGIGFFIIGSILEILMLLSCSNPVATVSNAKQEFCIPDSLLKNLTYDTLHSATVLSELSLSGKITFNEDNVVKIFPLVSGHVTEIKVSLGDYVEKGKVLAEIRSSDMANYFNEYKSSQSELIIAKKSLEVTANMQSSGVTSEKEYLIAQNEYQKALAQFNKIREILKINGSSISINDSTGSGYVIKAPISGFIAEKNVNIGMDIRPDANDNLFTISDLREVWAVANVFESDISKIKIGSTAAVSTLSYPDKKFFVKIQLENKDFSLKPGMFTHIAIPLLENRKMLSVKSDAIIIDENKSFVLRYRGKCKVSSQQINVYRSLNDLNFIESDSLLESDLVIARNGLYIFTAMKNL
jgi:membrane fusion protein, heavy metal efflux system